MKLYVGTRKGLFVVGARGIGKPHFLGDPVSMVLPDRDGTLYAALNLGHFGVKLRRSDDGGKSWQEVSAPEYPPQPADSADKTPWKLVQLWSLETDGQRLWAGTIPGGLFTSEDRGERWALVRSLWDEPTRPQWEGGFGGLCLHTICPWPGDPRRLAVAVSAAGVWITDDGGATWRRGGRGLVPRYLPEEARADALMLCVHSMRRARLHGAVRLDERALLPAVDQDHHHAPECQRRHDGRRVEESCVDGVVQEGARHRGREEGEHDQPEEPAAFRVAPHEAAQHTHDARPVQAEHGEDRAPLDDDVEGVDRGLARRRGVEAQQRAREDEVSRGAHREVLGDALHDTQDSRLEERQLVHRPRLRLTGPSRRASGRRPPRSAAPPRRR